MEGEASLEGAVMEGLSSSFLGPVGCRQGDPPDGRPEIGAPR